MDLARRIVDELRPDERLSVMIDAYREGGGVSGTVTCSSPPADRNPELVLRDAINNEVEITKHAEHCLVFDRPIPADGLTFQVLVDWIMSTLRGPLLTWDDAPERCTDLRQRCSTFFDVSRR